MRLKILSYNIHKGFDARNRTSVLKDIRRGIRATRADLVFLQEVLGHHSTRLGTHSTEQSQFEFLADELWPHFAYGKNAVYTSGHHGNAILSKYPFSFWENMDVSTNRLERRGLLHGTIEIPHHPKPFHVICVHLGLLEVERQEQVRLLCERIHRMVPDDEPVVISGDFNDWRMKVTPILESTLEIDEVFKRIHGAHPRTFPSWLPTLRLDRIYYRGLSPKRAKCLSGRPWNRLSDHVALFAELGF